MYLYMLQCKHLLKKMSFLYTYIPIFCKYNYFSPKKLFIFCLLYKQPKKRYIDSELQYTNIKQKTCLKSQIFGYMFK